MRRSYRRSRHHGNISIKWNDREVQNPILRIVLGFVLAVIWLLTMLFGMIPLFLVAIALIVFSPVLFILHFLLRALGRRGFVESSYPRLKIRVSANGFRMA